MENKEKLETLKGFLKENNIPFKENYQRKGWVSDLFIWKYRICVHISDENDQKFYEAIKRYLHPLFIRDNETSDFVIEKMQNLIIQRMKTQQKEALKRRK